jgi:hypothetical protein
MAIIQTTGTYARLDDNQQFLRWVDLVQGTEVAEGYFLPQVIAAEPSFDPDTEKLIEGTPIIDLVGQTATKTWIVVTLDLETVGDPIAFMQEFFDSNNSDRMRIGGLLADRAGANPISWFRFVEGSRGIQIRGGKSIFQLRAISNDNGFYKGLQELVTAAALDNGDKATINTRLKKNKLRSAIV